MLRFIFDRKRKKRSLLLRLAIQWGEVSDVERLLRDGADPNAFTDIIGTSAGDSPLVCAIKWSPRLEIIEALLKAGADPQEPYRFGGREFLLSEAASMNRLSPDIVNRLRQAEKEAEAEKGARKLRPGYNCRLPKFGI